ncbi:MAG: hypothetical protein EOS58_17090 [Mesorhizobium sp.]|nr:MAG: hypothetical protein EOS58_17090 [Mesorhizobium sp.]
MRVRLNLKKKAPDQYRTLARIEELLRPADLCESDARPSADNDNTGFGMDFRHEITPSNETFEEDVLAAYADGMRSRVVVHRNGTVERFDGGLKFQCERDGSSEILEVGGRSTRGRRFGMRFYRGLLVEYVKNGKRTRPSYQQKDPRGPDDVEWEPRASTASLPRPQALAEIDRVVSADALAAELGPDSMRLLRLVLEADSFAEIGKAYGYADSAAHRHGRRIAIDALRSAEKIAA